MKHMHDNTQTPINKSAGVENIPATLQITSLRCCNPFIPRLILGCACVLPLNYQRDNHLHIEVHLNLGGCWNCGI